MSTFKAWVVRSSVDDVHNNAGDGDAKPVRKGNTVRLETCDTAVLDDLDTAMQVQYSGINYKDALALNGKPGVVRRFPLIAGIDATGTVLSSRHSMWKVGDQVTLNGAGLGESLHGGLSEIAHVNGDDLVRIPARFGARRTAAIGTAGFTAALCVLALTHQGLCSQDGAVAVTGATGGVGSVTIALLADMGYRIAAVTGRPEQFGDVLRQLGASEVIPRSVLEESSRPLQSARWAGAVDAVGGQTLSSLLASMKEGASVAACGLAAGVGLHTTVMPFILRGVSLIGINSVCVSARRRYEAWKLLNDHLPLDVMDSIITEVPLSQAQSASKALLKGTSHGRLVIRI